MFSFYGYFTIVAKRACCQLISSQMTKCLICAKSETERGELKIIQPKRNFYRCFRGARATVKVKVPHTSESLSKTAEEFRES